MTATMHEPSTAGSAREGIADRLLVPAFWGAVSIVAMWLAVLFDGIFGGDMVFSNPSSARPRSRRRWPSRCSPSSARRLWPSAPSAAGTSTDRQLPSLDVPLSREGSAIRAIRQSATATQAPTVRPRSMPLAKGKVPG